MWRLVFFSTLFLLCTLATECAREVVIDLPEEGSKIVAISNFTTGDSFQVRVTLTQPLYEDGEVQAPAGTTVTVAAGGELYTRLTRQVTPNGIYWKSRKTVQPNVAYTLNVQLGGYPFTSATSAVPELVDIEPIIVNPAEITTETLSEERQQLRIPITLRLAGPLPAQPYFAFNVTSDIEVGGESPDFTIEGQQAYFAADGRTLSFLHNIPENVVLINEKYWRDGQRTLYLNALIPFKPGQQEHPVRLYVEWRTLSPEFYQYHLSVARQGSNLPLSEPDAVFNNVTNGYGNFSGYSGKVHPVSLSQ